MTPFFISVHCYAVAIITLLFACGFMPEVETISTSHSDPLHLQPARSPTPSHSEPCNMDFVHIPKCCLAAMLLACCFISSWYFGSTVTLSTSGDTRPAITCTNCRFFMSEITAIGNLGLSLSSISSLHVAKLTNLSRSHDPHPNRPHQKLP